MIKYICFDLDDTLCDYNEAKNKAISKINKVLEIENIDIDLYWNKYNLNHDELFRKYINGQLSLEKYRIERFLNVNIQGKTLNIDTAILINNIYINSANNDIKLFDDVIETLEYLQSLGVKIAILTNGPSDGQRCKIKALDIEKYTDYIFISSEIGYGKPKKEFFQYVLESLKCDSNEVIMVGDSINDDYEGAKNVNIDAFLIDRKENIKNIEYKKNN